MDFIRIVETCCKDVVASVEQRECPDQYVGILKDQQSGKNDFETRLPANARPDGTSCVILVLESPHRAEFRGVLGPAKGTTGRLIREKINSIDCFRPYSDYGLILLNAIQNQCSLGFSPDRFRDRIFVSVWDSGGKEAFITRIKDVYRNGDVIANCCTKGKNEEFELRGLVQECLIEVLPGVEPMRRAHPSRWMTQKNCNEEWRMREKV